MKFLYITIFYFTAINIHAQERFFTFVEGWTTMSIVEYDDKYIVAGTGLNNSNLNNIQFNRLTKTGELLTSWQINIPGTIISDIGTQQCLSDLKFGKRMMGITIITNDNIVKSRRLIFNDDFSEIGDSIWTYQPPQGEQSDIFVTYHKKPNEILHSVHYYTGSTVNSILVSTDTLGNTIWESSFPCGGDYCWMEPRHIHAAHDGGYIFTNNERRGFAEGGIVGELDIGTIIKTDSLGIQEWRIRPGGVGEPYDSGYILLQPTDDGNYLCAWVDNRIRTSDGATFDHYNKNPNVTIWFAKIAPDGSKLWEKNIADEIELWDVWRTVFRLEQMIRLPDGNFVILYQNSIIKINQEAEVIWARRLNPVGFESSDEQVFYYGMKGISHTSDGGLIITGEFVAFAGTVYSEYLQTGFVLKLDEYGCLEEGCQEDDPIVGVEEVTQAVSKLAIYPNPTNRDITIKYHLPDMPDELRLSIHNLTGEVVHTQSLSVHAGSVRVELGEYLPAGAYFCHLAVGGEVVGVERFVLVR